MRRNPARCTGDCLQRVRRGGTDLTFGVGRWEKRGSRKIAPFSRNTSSRRASLNPSCDLDRATGRLHDGPRQHRGRSQVQVSHRGALIQEMGPSTVEICCHTATVHVEPHSHGSSRAQLGRRILSCVTKAYWSAGPSSSTFEWKPRKCWIGVAVFSPSDPSDRRAQQLWQDHDSQVPWRSTASCPASRLQTLPSADAELETIWLCHSHYEADLTQESRASPVSGHPASSPLALCETNSWTRSPGLVRTSP